MSEEEKKIIGNKPITPNGLSDIWQKAKKAVILYDFIKVLLIISGVLAGEALMLENKIAEVLSTPKRTTAIEKRDSVKFKFVDSSLGKHTGYFTTIFNHVDTTQ